MIDVEQLTELYFATDEPVPYKLKCDVEILIHPVKVKDWAIFNSNLGILNIEKNETNDINIIKMSYLEFLANSIEQNSTILYNLCVIAKYSLHENIISIEENNGKKYLAILNEDATVKYFITSKEFDDIRKIILFQNIYDYDDRYISPDVRELYETYVKATSKNQENPTLERKKVFVLGKTGQTIKEINEMSYRTFEQVYITNIEIDLYYARKIIQASQKYDVKEDVIYPLFEKKKDKYEAVFENTGILKEKGFSGTEKLEGLR